MEGGREGGRVLTVMIYFPLSCKRPYSIVFFFNKKIKIKKKQCI